MNEKQSYILAVSKNRIKMLIADLEAEIGVEETFPINTHLLEALEKIEEHERAAIRRGREGSEA